MTMKMNHMHPVSTAPIALNSTRRRAALGVLGALLFAGLTVVGANIRIPLQPVPITLQTLFVLLSGAILGTRFGVLAQSIYLSLATLGLPVLAGASAGLLVVAGPTGGYFLGFLLAPVVVAKLIDRRDSMWWQATVFLLGSAVIVALGVLHLTAFYTHNLATSLGVGFLPFVPGDILKVAAAVSIYRSWHGLRRLRRS